MRALLARWIVLGMVALAVVVQIGVWGATTIHIGGSLLESWQRYFGWRYGLLFAVAQAVVCRWLALDRGIVWLVRTWAITGGAQLLLWVLTGRSAELTVDRCVALSSGMGALILAAALWEGDLVPGTLDRVRRS